MTVIWYLFTRLIMAVAGLMAVDAIANTITATEPTSIAAAFVLILIAEIVVAANVEQAERLTAADVVERHQKAEFRHHLKRLEDSNNGRD
jgi:hypothetical protein